MAKALGNNANEELIEGVSKLSDHISGDIGLLFTNESHDTIEDYMQNLCHSDYARAGCTATETIHIKAEDCPLKNRQTDENIPATAEPQLRACGLPSTLRGGHIMLTKNSYEVCEAGEKLNSDKCKLLKLLGIPMAHFRIHLVGHFSDGAFTSKDDSMDF